MLRAVDPPVTPFAQNCSRRLVRANRVRCRDRPGRRPRTDPRRGRATRTCASRRSCSRTPTSIMRAARQSWHARSSCRSRARIAATSSGSTGCPSRRGCSVSRRARRSRPTAGSTRAIACRSGAARVRGAALPGPHAGPRRVLLAGGPARVRRRRAVRGIDRPDRFSGWRLRHADRRDPRQAAPARRRRELRARARADVDVRRGTAQ